MHKKKVYILLITLLSVNILGALLYVLYIRGLVTEAFHGSAPIWFNKIIENLYPRFFVEKQRFDLDFFQKKSDQIIIRAFFVSFVIIAYVYLKEKFGAVNKSISGFWNKTTTNENLIVLRILYFALMMLIFKDIYQDMMALSKASSFYHPIPLFRILHIKFPSELTILFMYVLFIVSCLSSIFNLLPVISSTVVITVSIYFQGIIFGFEKTDHGFALMTYAGLIMPFLLYEYSTTKSSTNKAIHAWPLALIQTLIVSGYVFSGLEKIFISNWEWITSNTLKEYLILHGQKAGMAIAENKIVIILLSIFAILFEIGFILVLFKEKFKYLFLPAGIIFHLGVWYFLGVGGILHPWVFTYIFFIDWTKAVQMVKVHLPLKKVS